MILALCCLCPVVRTNSITARLHQASFHIKTATASLQSGPPQRMIYQDTRLAVGCSHLCYCDSCVGTLCAKHVSVCYVILLQSTIGWSRSSKGFAQLCVACTIRTGCLSPSSTDLCHEDQAASQTGPKVFKCPPQPTLLNITRHRC
jgi:hypothetical protein